MQRPAWACVLFLQNVFSYYRTCSLTTERVLLLQNVFSYYRMCSLRYMTVNQALEQLLETIKERSDIAAVLTEDTLCVGLARVGQDSQVCKRTHSVVREHIL